MTSDEPLDATADDRTVDPALDPIVDPIIEHALDSAPDATLVEVLTAAQRQGMLGDRPVPEVVAHARHFVRALDGVRGRVVDLGSGGGVPGLVIAVDRPDLEVVLVERRQKRADHLERAVRRLGIADRVVVRSADAAALGRSAPGTFDAVVARGFGPPVETLQLALVLLAPSGRVVISEPPAGERWSPADLDRLGVRRSRAPGVAVFRRRTDADTA